MKRLSIGFEIGLGAVATLAGLYAAGAVGIHISGPNEFIFWEMGLPSPLPTILWKLYGNWIFWAY